MRIVTAVLLVLFVAAGCASDGTPTGTDGSDGSGTGSAEPTDDGVTGTDPFGQATWQLTAATVDGAPLPLLDSHPITLATIADGQLGGIAACNHYGGPYTLDGGTITFGELSQTAMGCFPEEVQTLESGYLAALARVTTVTVEGSELVLAGDGVELRFAAQAEEPAAALTGTAWVLESLISGDAVSSTVAGSTATFTIDDAGAVTGSAGCNGFNGTITVEGDRFAPAALATTRMACEPGLAAQEQAVMAVLSGGPVWSIDGDVLTLTSTNDGSGLQYRAEPAG